MKLERHSFSPNLAVLQECVSPDPFKDIVDSDVEDGDDKLFTIESYNNDIEIL